MPCSSPRTHVPTYTQSTAQHNLHAPFYRRGGWCTDPRLPATAHATCRSQQRLHACLRAHQWLGPRVLPCDQRGPKCTPAPTLGGVHAYNLVQICLPAKTCFEGFLQPWKWDSATQPLCCCTYMCPCVQLAFCSKSWQKRRRSIRRRWKLTSTSQSRWGQQNRF